MYTIIIHPEPLGYGLTVNVARLYCVYCRPSRRSMPKVRDVHAVRMRHAPPPRASGIRCAPQPTARPNTNESRSTRTRIPPHTATRTYSTSTTLPPRGNHSYTTAPHPVHATKCVMSRKSPAEQRVRPSSSVLYWSRLKRSDTISKRRRMILDMIVTHSNTTFVLPAITGPRIALPGVRSARVALCTR